MDIITENLTRIEFPPGWPPGVSSGSESAGGQPGGAPLGIITKSHSALSPGERFDPETGEILTGDEAGEAAVVARLNRFMLQSAARSILPKQNRTRTCLRNRRATDNGVEVWRALDFTGAHYGNLMVCGSVWNCPVCAAKISERRRGELKQAIQAHGTNNGDVALVTLTFPHTRHDDLSDLLRRLSKALKLFKGNRAALKLRRFVGMQGNIRALEVTHGQENGWHPHIHEIWFIEPGHDLEWLRVELLRQWQRACRKAGLSLPSESHGVDVRPGHEAAWYVAKFGSEDDSKWDMTHELTKANTKKGRNGRSSPFDLLRRVAIQADKQAVALFNEYVTCFKGQRQLVWSRGLKKWFSIGESTDDDIAVEMREDAELLGSLTLHDWRKVLHSEARGLVLERARESWSAVVAFVSTLPALPPRQAWVGSVQPGDISAGLSYPESPGGLVLLSDHQAGDTANNGKAPNGSSP